MDDAAAADAEREMAQIKSAEEGQEWELYKENVRPLKKGRNIKLLNYSLKATNDKSIKQSILDKRRELIEAVDDYSGDDPLQPWLDCIKWVKESFPAGGDQSGLLQIYEQCVRSLWNDQRYHNDLRYLKIWLEYAEECNDPEIVCKFLYVNDIGTIHSLFYQTYASFLELKNKMKMANEVYSIGVARSAQPLDTLESAWTRFQARASKKEKKEDNIIEEAPERTFGTTLQGGTQQSSMFQDARRKKPLNPRNENEKLSIYIDPNVSHPPAFPLSMDTRNGKEAIKQEWVTLGTRAERNKENASIPSKWTTHKIPQRNSLAVHRVPELEVFVDEDCASNNNRRGSRNAFALHLRRSDAQTIKREAELLKENPLMNFPKQSLPR